MSGSGAALDPLFWVVPGAVDRLYQRVVFENVLSGNLSSILADLLTRALTHPLTHSPSI